jgi:putative ABC transport system permease protein
VEETMEYAEATIKKLSPDHEFSYGFLDERMENTYRAEKKIGNILYAFSVLALVVLCLGLFGLLGFTVSQRYKEISIRKVFGANTMNVLFLLSREYLVLMIIAIAIAIPVSNYVITEWLYTFAFRDTMEILTFIAPGAILIAISMSIVLGQAYRATQINAANTLRAE